MSGMMKAIMVITLHPGEQANPGIDEMEKAIKAWFASMEED
jgi:hypothetical protein